MTDVDTALWRSDLELIADAARQAGDVALGYFNQSPEVWWKNEGRSPVSAADFAANQKLESILRAARPDYGWLSEETEDDGDRLSRDTLFIIDPIDGTRAFLAGLELWCVSVAVVRHGRPVAGVLYAPALEELYEAVEGGVALKNGQPITVSTTPLDAPGRFAIAEDVLKAFPEALKHRIERVRHVPSLAYRIAMVADGQIDGTFIKHNSHDWDLAAADLILERAGGRLVDLQGDTPLYNRIKVSHDELCAAAAPRLSDLLTGIGERRGS
ncbi:3'(2'),5'-bisphosphate nucleotidase CysQ [Rhizobium sp. R72]|uniref:3'(2'),5'-bisphosphate nucleotidase CysQ n=1 Tax=unclassified Rhizobium TaxID=2613769 RepID=UPI000B52BA46|nr:MULTISPECIES: 3'(2'),5'-bisphosphate nucleotidase CysQ [unclassified Rhizobium]OWV94933.1 3'(2'),5'-bisphosphate nucleotidase CysQ [Rhizobium sp. R72]OWV95173.1 3'(2'),5'-bisphosphate nucleotidase CysQ [Rhizobium sp. R711]